MVPREPAFKRSFEILSSTLILVIIAFLFDLIFKSALANSLSWLTLLFFLPAKIYLVSGLYGSLVEIVSGQEMVANVALLKRNVKSLWKLYAPFALFELIAYLPYSTTSSFSLVPFSLIPLFFLSYVIVAKKYLKPFKIERKKINISVINVAVVLALLLIDIVLSLVLKNMAIGKSQLLLIAISRCLHFLFFLYITTLFLDGYPEIYKKFDAKKEIFLIHPVWGGVFDHLGTALIRYYPAVFIVLKALTPKNYTFREFNRINWHKRFYKKNKLVAITCTSSNSYEAYKIAKEFKKRGSTVIMGGVHVSYFSDEALEFCDSVVIGEVEGVWKQVIHDYENNCLQKKYLGYPKEDFYTETHLELLNSPPEIIHSYLETIRGCKYKCDFCTIPSLSGHSIRHKPIAQTVELIKKMGPRYAKDVKFIDNNIYADPAHSRELFKALIPLNIQWKALCTIDVAKNDEILSLAKKSGCSGFLIGYEIFTGSSEKKQGGKFTLSEQYIQLSNKIKKIGIRIKAHMIIGWDSDNVKSVFRLWKFCFTINPYACSLSLLTPLPGSNLFYFMIKENRITNLSWRNYSYHRLAFRHKQINGFILGSLFTPLRFLYLYTTTKVGYGIMAIAAFMTLVFLGLSFLA
ncbi:B12-binding domain-containing radical SAM protein [Candidatus Omnitrophota bacterium]